MHGTLRIRFAYCVASGGTTNLYALKSDSNDWRIWQIFVTGEYLACPASGLIVQLLMATGLFPSAAGKSCPSRRNRQCLCKAGFKRLMYLTNIYRWWGILVRCLVIDLLVQLLTTDLFPSIIGKFCTSRRNRQCLYKAGFKLLNKHLSLANACAIPCKWFTFTIIGHWSVPVGSWQIFHRSKESSMYV